MFLNSGTRPDKKVTVHICDYELFKHSTHFGPGPRSCVYVSSMIPVTRIAPPNEWDNRAENTA